MIRMFYRYGLLTALVAIIFSSCGPLIPKPSNERSYFVITDKKTVPEQKLPKIPIHLLVRDAKANRFINSHKIIFSSDPSTRGFYQLAQWVEPPPERLSSIVLSRLEQSAAFNAVSRMGNSALGDYQLNMEITEFYHDIKRRPGLARAIVTAELVDLANREIIARNLVEASVPVKQYSAKGAVDGLTKATNSIADAILLWLTSSLSNKPLDSLEQAASGKPSEDSDLE